MTTYSVQTGDTPYKIAKIYSLTLQELIDINPSIKNPNFIQVGDTINIPSTTEASTGLDPDDVDVMARTIMGEARGEANQGKAAVGWVISNRVSAGTWYSGSVFEVCRKPYQFSCWNVGDPNFLTGDNPPIMLAS
jgi:N-acetylmuramoyl-L-alanine amidase